MLRRTPWKSGSAVATIALVSLLGPGLVASQEPAPTSETLVRQGMVGCAAYATAMRVMVCEHATGATPNEVVAAPSRHDTPVTGAVYSLRWDTTASQGKRLELKFLPLDAATQDVRFKATGTIIGAGACCGVTLGGVHGESVLSIYLEARPGAGGIYHPHAGDTFTFRVEPVAALATVPAPGAYAEDPASLAYLAGVIVELPFKLCVTYVYEGAPLPSVLDDPCYEAPPAP